MFNGCSCLIHALGPDLLWTYFLNNEVNVVCVGLHLVCFCFSKAYEITFPMCIQGLPLWCYAPALGLS